MIKLASTFIKRPKESKPKSKTYQALSLRDRNNYKKHTEKQKEQEVNLGNESNELTTLVPRTQESRKEEAETEPENVDEISGTTEETESDYSVNISRKETDGIIVKATEVILEENANEIESPRTVLENVENVGNIDEIRDKIREVESEIKQLDKKGTQIASEEINKEKDAENVTEEKNSTNEKGPHDKSHFQGETNAEQAEQVNINNNEKQEMIGKKESAEILDEQNGHNDERIKETNLNTEGKEETEKRNGEHMSDANDTEEKEIEQITENDEKRMESGDEKIGNEEAETNQTPKHTVEEMSALGDAEQIKSVTETPEEKQQILAAAEDLQEKNHERENVTEENPTVLMEAEEAVSSAKDDQQADGNENDLHSEIEESKILKGESNNDNSAAITEEAENEENIQVEGEVEAKAEEPEQLTVIKNDIQEEVQHTTENIENNAEEPNVTFSKLEEEEGHDERSDNKGEEEGKPNEVINAQVQSADSTTEKETEMFGEGLLKNEKLESGELIESEKHAEVVENSEIVKQEISETEPVVEEDKKSDENDSTPLMPDSNGDDKESEGKQTEETEKNEMEKVSESSDINLQKDAILENAAVGCPVETSLQKETTEDNANSKIIEEQTTADEERLPGTEGAKQEATDINVVQEFLDHEQEYSSHDKQIANEVQSRADITESQLKSEAVTDSATPKMSFAADALQNEENLQAVENEKKYDNTDWEGDEDQQKDVSTTSDEIEFEPSPTKYPDDPTSTTGETASTEPVIVVNEDSTEQKMASVEEYVDESKKTLLEVPMPVLKEYPRKKISEIESDEPHRTKRSVDEKTSVDELGEEIIIDCGNVGNEIIQRGQVQKVELVEGEEDILQVHLTTTIETEQHDGGNVHLEMSSRIEPEIEVLVETKLESPIPENHDKLRIVRAAVVIQNGFRRFKNRRNAGEVFIP